MDKNVLRIENSVETSFLPESELPLYARLSGNTPDAEGNDRSESLLRSAAQSGNYKNFFSFIILFYKTMYMKVEELLLEVNSCVFSSFHSSTNTKNT